MCASASHAEPPCPPQARRPLALWARVLVWPLIALVRFYKAIISPLLPPSCRFYPSCSSYGLEALQLHGPVKGLYLTVHRVLRCSPFSEGGLDPVPGSELQRRQREGELDDPPADPPS